MKRRKQTREESLKIAVRDDYFSKYRYTQLGNIDFVVATHNLRNSTRSLFEELEDDGLKSILWAEAKQGTGHDIYESLVQLILTVGKERTYEKYLPPKYIGAFDAEKFAFIEYHEIQQIFYQNDFNWNVAPSNHDTKEFRQLYRLCKEILEGSSILFKYREQEREFKDFIRLNFRTDKEITEKISVTKNNFTFVFQHWTDKVRPSIAVDWEMANKAGIISADFFLADLLSENGESLKDSLYVVLKRTRYELAKSVDEMGMIASKTVGFKDRQRAYKEFWSIYQRPPKEEYWDYIIGRRDLLVPQDIRERRGSYFTPRIWVEKSQQYLAEVLGEGWQEEYYIWDCCAGTGNLLNGLANYRNVFASTLDKQDVDVMRDRIANGWSMFENHVFQFDFLNDDFDKCPEALREILRDEQRRRRLVIYINPPYAEAASVKTISGTGENKTNVAVSQRTYERYLDKIGIAGRELFAQFFIRIYYEIGGCILAEFSKLKMLQAPNFDGFRQVFRARLERLFVVPAKTFDNVKGNFPIGFFIWNTAETGEYARAVADVYDEDGRFLGQRTFTTVSGFRSINDWIITTRNRPGEEPIGFMYANGADFQHNSFNYIVNDKSQLPHPRGTLVSTRNVREIAIYLAVRQCIPQSWLNDRDQFLFPKDGWQQDGEFQSDCLALALFHGQNRISCEHGVNHWIPFTEQQVGCRKAFKSNFMSRFLAGEVEERGGADLFSPEEGRKPEKLPLSAEAGAVYGSALELWRYYHSQPKAQADASFYDIRRFFQGETKGRMNNASDDETYSQLIAGLRENMRVLAKKIEPKVYEYGFLR